MLNVYVLIRDDDWEYDFPVEKTVVAKSKERAIEIASKNAKGIWIVDKEVDLNIEQILTIDKNDG